ncbi:hypothetical protein GALMADRAFT_225415 [Galerina marginata CBS 339.88]|uniref:Yeast cell wall synthesis Kre9/Knh1-like N-terminal domain-containing protein n=1 Tax=Galerina marginata (strain CBS 339.88) TaxID=685588 RepID=A0A067TBM4_GALM3|nr:hypothetical protein GALMADRAFT_225415 [Galerina marginata CBS 339.88]
MYSTYLALALAILLTDAAVLVNAALFIVQPSQGSTCTGGKPCTVTWVDDGTRPLLSAVGVSTVGLFTGHQKLVQTITPVDVGSAHSFTFTPNPAAGPNAGSYYVAITSTSLKGNDSVPYSGWSPFFNLVGMSGSFDSPLPAATSPISIPASLTQSSTRSRSSTITVGTLPTAQPSPPVISPSVTPSPSSQSSASKLTTLLSPPSTPAATSAPAALTTAVPAKTSGAGPVSHLPPMLHIFALLFAVVLFS